jgi:hypothetical protein
MLDDNFSGMFNYQDKLYVTQEQERGMKDPPALSQAVTCLWSLAGTCT